MTNTMHCGADKDLFFVSKYCGFLLPIGWLRNSDLSNHLVYGAMSKIGLLRIFLLQFNFVWLFCIFKPFPTRIEQSPFSPLHVWLPVRSQNGRFIQGSKNQLTHIKLKSCHLVRLIIRILKMYGLLYRMCNNKKVSHEKTIFQNMKITKFENNYNEHHHVEQSFMCLRIFFL